MGYMIMETDLGSEWIGDDKLMTWNGLNFMGQRTIVCMA